MTVYEPCADSTGIDTDGDGINDICDLDNDNDGILDSEECLNSEELVNNGNFTNWIFYNSWTGSGQSWNKNANRAYYAQWNGAGTATFYQTINVSPNILNTITFDVGAYADHSGESTLEVKIDGVVYYTETSTQIAATNGGNSQDNNETLNMVSRSFSFTPTTSTVILSFDGSSPVNNHDLLYVDNVILGTGCGDLDGDGITDIYDLDSDGDGCFDALEGAGGLDFSDLNGDGTISGSLDSNGVPIAVSGGQGKGSSADYTVTSGLCDDDGDGVDNANDKCPYFDDAIDSDNDGIPDGCDVDDDNDGVSDCDESTESVSNEFAWTMNTPAGNLEMDTDYTPEIDDWILDGTNTMVLNSPIFSVSGSNLRVEPLPAANKEEAVANGDYVEVSFTTGSELSSFMLSQIRTGWYLPNQGDSYYTATAYTKVGSDVWTTLSEDVLHTDDGSTYATFQHLGADPLYLDANTEYAFRFYVYGQIDDSSQSYSILDDIAFGFTACRNGDLDGDTTPNHLDDDSDDDGCRDADEAYGAGTDIDSNGMYGSGSPVVNSDGSVAAASYDAPRDGDSNGNYDFLQSGTAPSITVQPQDVIVCSGCNITMEVSASSSDSYQWQLYNGTIWEDLTDTGIHSGTTTSTLTITNPPNTANGNQYRVIVSNSAFVCSTEVSDIATLNLQETTVITNRRITYRIKKD